MSFFLPIRRGGIIGHGSSMTVDWMPGRGNSFNIGFNIPIFGHYKGITRPRQNYVVLPSPEPVCLGAYPTDIIPEAALENIGTLSLIVTELTVPYIDHAAWTRDKALEKFRSDMEEISSLLDSLSVDKAIQALHHRCQT